MVISGSSICAQIAVDHLAEIVRRDIRGHADGDAGAAVDQQIGKRGGEDDGLGAWSRRSSGRNRPCPCPCRPSARRRDASGAPRCNAWRRADRPRPSRNFPGHRPAVRAWPTAAPCARASDRSPPRRADGNCPIVSPHDLGALEVLPVREERQVVHRVKDAALGRLEAVARIGQRAGDDDATSSNRGTSATSPRRH